VRRNTPKNNMNIAEYDDLADDDLERIERLIHAATAGPWISYVAGRDPDATSSYIELGSCNELGTFRSLELVGTSAADQDFIASARQDLPRLLREVRALRARLNASLEEPSRPELQAAGGRLDAPVLSRPAPM
jgi:hypothetical protein